MRKDFRTIAVIGIGVYAGLMAWSLTMQAGPLMRPALAQFADRCGESVTDPCHVKIENILPIQVSVVR